MKEIYTNISSGYLPLLEIFAKANSLDLKFNHYSSGVRQFAKVLYEENSDTEYSITFLSAKHLGFENMLCDYLKRCGIQSEMIPIGKVVMRKSDAQLEEEWQKHRKTLGI